jgi:hypothetical protein
MRKLACLLSITLLFAACDDVSYVERLVLVNPTDYNVLVDAKGGDGASWLPLGIANRNAETVKEELIDMGPTWVFRFSYAGEQLSQDPISRRDLVRRRWRYEIPERVGQSLKEKGYAPSYQ